MSTRRRFIIFLSSAAIMSIFILFTLGNRGDKPIDRWLGWLPGNRVVSMLTEVSLGDGKTVPKPLRITEESKAKIDALGILDLEIRRNLNNSSVYFRHELTQPRNQVKQYVISTKINLEKYYLLVAIYPGYVQVLDISLHKDFKN